MTLMLLTLAFFQQCIAPPESKTIWGGNTHVVTKEQKIKGNISGVVFDQQGHPMSNVLVEVYDHPEIMLRHLGPELTGQNRLKACITTSQGLFVLDVPPGYYELRFSKSSEWNVTSMPIRVKKSTHPSKKSIAVQLSLGT